MSDYPLSLHASSCFVDNEAATDSGREGLFTCIDGVDPRLIGRPVDWPVATRDKTRTPKRKL